MSYLDEWLSRIRWVIEGVGAIGHRAAIVVAFQRVLHAEQKRTAAVDFIAETSIGFLLGSGRFTRIVARHHGVVRVIRAIAEAFVVIVAVLLVGMDERVNDFGRLKVHTGSIE